MTFVRSAACSDLRPLELTDLLWDFDMSGVRRPVRVATVVDALENRGQRRAARLARRLPSRGGWLDEDAVDALLLRVHCELQRLGEELQQPRRVAEALRTWTEPWLATSSEPVRVVDVGCGIGHTLRWLAASGALGPRVELVGVDTNAVLVDYAIGLTGAEQLGCRFVRGDAFAPGAAVDDPGRTVVISAGLLHHLTALELQDFFAAQSALGVARFAHWDLDPVGWAVLGAWVFHRARMREPLSRHDGVLSARRAHPARTLVSAAVAGAAHYEISCEDGSRWWPAVADVLRPVSGIRR